MDPAHQRGSRPHSPLFQEGAELQEASPLIFKTAEGPPIVALVKKRPPIGGLGTSLEAPHRFNSLHGRGNEVSPGKAQLDLLLHERAGNCQVDPLSKGLRGNELPCSPRALSFDYLFVIVHAFGLD